MGSHCRVGQQWNCSLLLSSTRLKLRKQKAKRKAKEGELGRAKENLVGTGDIVELVQCVAILDTGGHWGVANYAASGDSQGGRRDLNLIGSSSPLYVETTPHASDRIGEDEKRKENTKEENMRKAKK